MVVLIIPQIFITVGKYKIAFLCESRVQQLASKEIIYTEKSDEVVVCWGKCKRVNFQENSRYQKLLMNFEIMFLVQSASVHVMQIMVSSYQLHI